jgi:benzodiazapine receptor
MTKLGASEVLRLIACILICEAVGVLGSFATRPRIPGWYATLVKPSFQPPAWLFGPVWTLLYLLMGISLFLVWRLGMDRSGTRVAVVLFAAQLAINLLWSFVFFGERSPLGGFVVIIVLWALIVSTMVSFARLSAPAAILLIPYILWVSFAIVLNGAIVKLNR